MDKHTLIAKTQASRTSLLLVFTCLVCLQLSRTSHCIMISDIHSTAPLTMSKPTLFNLYLLSCCKTSNSKVDRCYSTSINVYGSVKLTTVLLDPIINYNQLGSETRKPSNCSKRTDVRRSQQENSDAGSSSLVKLSCKGGKPKMVDAFSASPAHTHNSTKDEKGHPWKPDKRNKPMEG